jgi:hypothetical protein
MRQRSEVRESDSPLHLPPLEPPPELFILIKLINEFLIALRFTQIGNIPTGDCEDCGWLRRKLSQCHHNSFFPFILYSSIRNYLDFVKSLQQTKIPDKMLYNPRPVQPQNISIFHGNPQFTLFFCFNNPLFGKGVRFSSARAAST